MKMFLCIMLCVALLLCLCGCQNTGGNSSDVEVIVEEIYDTQGDYSSNSQNTGSTVIHGSQGGNSSVSSGSSSSSNNETTNTSNIYSFNDAATLKNIKLNGRCEQTDKGVSLGYVASAIEFNTDASAAMMVVEANAGVYYAIMVDGKLTAERQITTQGTNYINLARGLSDGTHNIKIIRDGENRTDTDFIAVSLQLDEGKLLAKDGKKLVVEFLGDSLTSGYGNLVVNGVQNPQELKHQSSVKSYGFLVANKLNLDYRIVSQSGIALQQREGYVSFFDFYNIENYHKDRNKKYTSSSPKDVDIVVVNLGTNDIGAQMYDPKNSEQVATYVKHYADLITNIGYRKDAKILFVTGVWHRDPAIVDGGVVRELKSRGYNNAYALVFPTTYKSGGGSHPSSAEHQEMANIVINFFKENGIV